MSVGVTDKTIIYCGGFSERDCQLVQLDGIRQSFKCLEMVQICKMRRISRSSLGFRPEANVFSAIYAGHKKFYTRAR